MIPLLCAVTLCFVILVELICDESGELREYEDDLREADV
jgi:hypothetical protein